MNKTPTGFTEDETVLSAQYFRKERRNPNDDEFDTDGYEKPNYLSEKGSFTSVL